MQKFMYAILTGIVIVGVILIYSIVNQQNRQNSDFTTKTNTNQVTTNQITISRTNTSITTTFPNTSSTTVSKSINWQNNSQRTPNLQSCGSSYTLFSTPLFDPNSVVSVLPLADFIPPDHVFPTPHAYIYTTNPTTHVSKDGAYFYAPANMILTQIAIRNLGNTFGVYKNATDYTLVFSPCKEFDLYFHNVASLLYPPFINVSSQLKKNCGNQVYCSMQVNIPIGIGQPIGTIGNTTAGIQGLDVGARDYRLSTGRSAFVDADRLCPLSYDGQPNVFDRCYTVCPYSYFTQQIQQTIHFSSVDGNVTGSSCGTVYQDVNGAAKGYWFPANGRTSSISPEATDIFLGQDNLQQSLGIFSIGISVRGLPANRYSFQYRTSGFVNRDFSNVISGTVFCYEANSLSGTSYQVYGPSTVIYVELLNKTTLLIQKQNTTTCSSGPWIMSFNSSKFVR